MIVTKCDRCLKVMDTPAYAQLAFPLFLPNSENKPASIPKYLIIRCEPNEGRDTLNLCPECEKDFDAFLDTSPYEIRQTRFGTEGEAAANIERKLV